MTATQPASISEANQASDLGALVELFVLDLTVLGGSVLRFTSTAHAAAAIVFDGNTYTPINVEASGFIASGGGSLPTPSLKISNVLGAVSSVILEFNDLVGAGFQRIRTYKRFLDGEASADPTAFLPIDYFNVERKVQQNKVFVEWALSAAMDAEGAKIPGRQVLREVCTQQYRTWSASLGAYVYTNVTCPYVGANAFNEKGDAVAVDLDRCGKRLLDCRLRFGQNGVLPGWFFPGAGGQR